MNEKLFNKIYSENYESVFNYIRWKLNDPEKAQEIANDVFMKVYKHYGSFDPAKSAFSTWLQTITNRCIIDNYRTDHSEHYVNVSQFADAETGKETYTFVGETESSTEIESKEFVEMVGKVFRSLKPKYRKIAILYFLRQKNYNEIAELCDVPMGTVKGMIARCRAMLQESGLKEMYYAM